MLVDKLPWCSHEGLVSTVHVQPRGGARFATGGTDQKVKVWALNTALDAKQEHAPGASKLLSTLVDHTGPINVVRFSHNGRFLASGSDDRMVCVYEFRAGAGGGTTLGVEGPNLETWRTRLVLRGHSNNIMDLGWSPDDARIATGSCDNRVIIWDAASGQQRRALDLHTNFVKGLAWDPVGTYLATQAGDKTVVVWRAEDWSVAGTVRRPFAKMVSGTFSNRLSWSPDGQFLVAGNSYQGATHAAVLVPRERWEEAGDYLLISGHQGAVVSTAFNPRLFHLPPAEGGAPAGEAGTLSSIFALGSHDKRITGEDVWASGQNRPLFCGSSFFKSHVADIAWTPDGYALLAAAGDGTVACLQFEKAELGPAAAQEEVDDVLQALYGNVRGGGPRRIFAESADQLALEDADAAAKAPARPPPVSGRQPALAELTTNGRSIRLPVKPTVPTAVAALDARLAGRAGGDSDTQFGFGPSTSAALPAPVRAAGAHVRIAPEPMEAAAAPPAKRARAEPSQPAAGPVVAAAGPLLRPLPARPEIVAALELPPEPAGSIGEAQVPRELKIVNRERGSRGRPQADINCLQGRNFVWSDIVQGAAVAACGSQHFAAVALQDGHLLLYSAAGRRLSAPLKLGSGIARLACDKNWRLLALTTSGTVLLFDVGSMACVSKAALGPLLEDGATLQGAALSRNGVPLITLTNSRVYAFSPEMDAWMCVADEACATSQFMPLLRLRDQGELSSLQADAVAAGLPRAGMTALKVSGAPAQHSSRAHLECNLAGALVLQSPGEYRRWLGTYARFLTEQEQQGRLDELCKSLIGPTPLADDQLMGLEDAGEADCMEAGAAQQPRWEASVLGVSKRELLADVLREMSRNRNLQRLVAQYRDALQDCEELAGGSR